MTPGENGETVSMPHKVHRRAPIQCFLVLVLVNLMWAFQFSGAKIATERLGPIAVALIPLALKGVRYEPKAADVLLRNNLLIYGFGGIVIPFVGIWAIDVCLGALHLA